MPETDVILCDTKTNRKTDNRTSKLTAYVCGIISVVRIRIFLLMRTTDDKTESPYNRRQEIRERSLENTDPPLPYDGRTHISDKRREQDITLCFLSGLKFVSQFGSEIET
jgi:hypothetical protein